MRETLANIEYALTTTRRPAVDAIRALVRSERGLELLALVAQEAGVAIKLFCDERLVGHAVILAGSSGVRFSQITPGSYSLVMSSGRVLWARKLFAREVLSAWAFPEEPLAVAAQTTPLELKPTVDEVGFEPALRLRVFPGRESGAISVVLRTTQ